MGGRPSTPAPMRRINVSCTLLPEDIIYLDEHCNGKTRSGLIAEIVSEWVAERSAETEVQTS